MLKRVRRVAPDEGFIITRSVPPEKAAVASSILAPGTIRTSAG